MWTSSPSRGRGGEAEWRSVNICSLRNQNGGEKNGLGRREKRPKNDREEGERKQKIWRQHNQHCKGGGRVFFKKCDVNVQGLGSSQFKDLT